MKKSILAFFLVTSLLGYCETVSAGTVAYSYDAAGRLTQAAYTEDKAIHYTYNTAGNLLQRRIGAAAELDSNGDGIPDSWYLQHGLDPFDATIADRDSDGDGFSNRDEYHLGTDPGDALSVFRAIPEWAATAESITIEWSAVAGKTYRVQYKNSLTDPQWEILPGDVTATGPVASKTDPGIAGQKHRFYRVTLVP